MYKDLSKPQKLFIRHAVLCDLFFLSYAVELKFDIRQGRGIDIRSDMNTTKARRIYSEKKKNTFNLFISINLSNKHLHFFFIHLFLQFFIFFRFCFG